jgi:methyltransferase (TIGR00027 family)
MMSENEVLVRGVADTALWVAYFRACESKRTDAVFRDPFAEQLAGERGVHLANTLRDGNKQEWVWVARTYLCDQFVERKIAEGADLVLNLAAGLDARPYRMNLPSSLRWVEVDLPEVISYKEQILGNEAPRCDLRRVSMNLGDGEGRRRLFQQLSGEAQKIVVLAEGLLIYLTEGEVGELASDLSRHENFGSWVIDLASPMQLKLMQWTMGKQLGEGGAPFRFGPAAGVDFFQPYGWDADDVQGLLKTAAQLNRAPSGTKPIMEEPRGPMGKRQWNGVCLLKNRNRHEGR